MGMSDAEFLGKIVMLSDDELIEQTVCHLAALSARAARIVDTPYKSNVLNVVPQLEGAAIRMSFKSASGQLEFLLDKLEKEVPMLSDVERAMYMMAVSVSSVDVIKKELAFLKCESKASSETMARFRHWVAVGQNLKRRCKKGE